MSLPSFRDLLPFGDRVPRALREAPRLPSPLREAARPREILLVVPFYPRGPEGSFGKHVLTPSQSLSALAAATPPSWRVRFWDENLLQGPPPTEFVPELVGITVHLTFARRALALAAWFRARGARVVLGGPHLDACAHELSPHADALVVGNGVSAWPMLLRDLERGALEHRYVGAWTGFASEPLPDRSILPPWAFLTPLSLVATRGCHNACDFCWLSTRGARPTRERRPVSQIVEEFVRSGHPYGVFVDNNLGSDKAYLHQLCRALTPLRRIWSAAVSLDVTDDPSLIRAMAGSGCTGVFVGFESLSEANLRESRKRGPDPGGWKRRVELFHAHGIEVNGSFVVGFDHDGPEVFDRVVDWVEDARLECATYHILTPYPGTPLFERMEAEGRLLHRDWDLYDTAHCVFRPARMRPEALEAGYARMYRRSFSLTSIWKRRPREAKEVPAYLAMAALYKRANLLWPFLIRHRLVHGAWRPLVRAGLARHLARRDRREERSGAEQAA